jgi:hypothetical protein
MKDTVQLSGDDLVEIADNRVTEAFRLLLARGYEISFDNHTAVLTGNTTWSWQSRARRDDRTG